MKRIVVTGGSGKAGRAVVRDLLEHGYEVLNVDLAPPAERRCPFLKADLANAGETFEALAGCDAVAHMAAIPAPGLATEEVTFRTNISSEFNVLHAAASLKMARVVWASKPRVRADRRGPSPVPRIQLRALQGPGRGDGAAAIAPLRHDRRGTAWNLWGYIDARDVAQGVRLALEKPVRGALHLMLAAADTVMDRPSRDLMKEVYPNVPIRKTIGEHETLLSIDRARSVLGYSPSWSWRNQRQEQKPK